MSKKPITTEFLKDRIGLLTGQKAVLLQKAQSILVSAQRAEKELIAEANAVHGAIQQCEELLGMLTEAKGPAPAAGSPIVPPVDTKPAANKLSTKERQLKRHMERRAAAAKPGKLNGRITKPGGAEVLHPGRVADVLDAGTVAKNG